MKVHIGNPIEEKRSYSEQVLFDQRFMKFALEEAGEAGRKGEVPIGCAVVYGDRIVARAHNLRETRRDPMAHAEAIALRKASLRMDNWRLTDCTIYSTLEPCPMCMGALVLARVRRLVFATHDARWGAAGSLYDLSKDPRLNHRIVVRSGVLEEESRELLQAFFAELRARAGASRSTRPR